MVKFGFDKMWRVCWLAKELLPSQEWLLHGVNWLPIVRYLVSFPCIYWRSLVLLYTQAQNTHHAFLHNAKFFFKFCTTLLELLLPGAAESSISVAKWLTRTWRSSRLLINVSERKHTDHIHVIKHATLYRIAHTHISTKH
jgi:hypothetical protein